ncbi:alpha-L-rhamnosidase [Sphingomonas sp. 8AM]|uniref:alpha-L-rhamnosidase n=1 Tax=Sphingomonas sp. 8AM TaxID=2653170 RepID=UPI0012F40C50|nr:alpha-L-rhamnosidase [Sphingomonas sp. 8AM]VXC34872.1 Bacterial alpha-L-rhamnosidase [Sphingomonas sp. 8AM]
MARRRSVLMGAGAGLALLPARVGAFAGAPGWSVDGLLVGGLRDPMGLHEARPRLSWQLRSDRRGARQAAWRVGVASSAAAAAAGRYDLWDSGRVAGEQCFDVAYAGAPLAARQRAWWRVTAWDEAGAVATSPVAFWEMGLLAPSDWSAAWLSAETPAQRDDRDLGLPWRSAAPAVRGERVTFRLRFDAAQDGELTALIGCSGNGRVRLDDAEIIAPKRGGWGAPGPRSAQVPVAAGAHVLTIETRASGAAPAQAATLLRIATRGRRTLRVGGETLEYRIGERAADDGWLPTGATGGQATMPARAATLLRRPFRVDGRVADARLYLTALGMYEAELNGRRLDDALLRPEFTDYRKHCLYCVEDVTDTLVPGDNVLGVHVADGWYGSYISPDGRYSFGEPPLRIFGQLEIRYVDGRVQTVATGPGWTVAESPVTSATIYDGERYDARRARAGWSRADVTPGADWSPAVPATSATAALIAATVPPIRRKERMPALAVTTLADGASVVDFGQNFTGWVRVALTGRRGQTVRLRYAELLNPDGSVDQSNLRAADATDHYTFAGDGIERYEPRFTYHGFRYVQVEGLGRPITAAEITGISIRSDLTETSDLRLGSYVPQRLWQNSRWSQRSNFTGLPTDCPQRDERLGWTGDAHVFWDAASFNMDTAAFTQRFMRDMRDAQRDSGAYSDIAPVARHDHFAEPGSSPGWGDAGVALPWTVWQRYGDTGIIDQHWTSMARFLASIEASNPGFVWSKARGVDYGDWLALDAVNPGDPTTPKDLIGTAFWKGAADQMADMARASGRAAEATHYAALAGRLGEAFRRTFVKVDGTIGNGSQTGYILALHFDLLAPGARAGAAQRLVADIRRRGTLLSTGFLGTPYSLDVLADAGEIALVYDLLLRTGYPSWGYMIAKGATTTWERWNSDAGDRSMNSFNHYALGAVVGFMFRRIAGIAPAAPGFTRFTVRPLRDARMTTAGATYDSRLGRISTRWTQEKDRFALDLTVPVGSVARVHLPAAPGARILEAGKPVATAERTDREAILRVPAGGYRFEVG